MVMVRQSARITFLILAVALVGCGGEDLSRFKEGLVPVTGTVTLDGKPAEDVGVLFVPASAASYGGKLETGTRVAMGKTDAQGKFSLISPPHGAGVVPDEYVGCLPGEYIIAFDRRRMPDGSVPDPKSDSPDVMRAQQTIPAKYVDPKTSGFKASVGPDGGEFKFDLTSK